MKNQVSLAWALFSLASLPVCKELMLIQVDGEESYRAARSSGRRGGEGGGEEGHRGTLSKKV